MSIGENFHLLSTCKTKIATEWLKTKQFITDWVEKCYWWRPEIGWVTEFNFYFRLVLQRHSTVAGNRYDRPNLYCMPQSNFYHTSATARSSRRNDNHSPWYLLREWNTGCGSFNGLNRQTIWQVQILRISTSQRWDFVCRDTKFQHNYYKSYYPPFWYWSVQVAFHSLCINSAALACTGPYTVSPLLFRSKLEDYFSAR